MPFIRHSLFYVFLLCLAGSHEIFAQNINGEKIQVAGEALTVLKFNSEIKRYELGDRTGYTCQVRDNDNSLVIKTLKDKPEGTNLLVTEGKRTHYFIVTFLPKIDLNNTRLYYDYSDLKALRKLVENSQAVAANNPPPAEAAPEEKLSAKEKRKKEKEQEQALEEGRKKAEELEKQRIAAQKKEAEKAKLLAEQEQAKKDAEKKEQDRIAAEKKKAEDDRLAKIEKDKQEQIAKEQERIQKEKEKQAQIAAAKEEARKKKEQEEAARIQKIKDEREAAIAKKKEEDRLAAERRKQLAEEQERKRLEAENEKKLAALKEKQRKEDEKQQKLAKLAEEKRLKEEQERAKKEAEEAKTTYTQAELWKKYPNIVFGDPPDGQHMTGEYYVPTDTAENYRVSQLLLAMPPWLSASSDTVANVSITLQSMLFSGVNCYMRFTVHNKSKKDFLIGNMNLEWHKDSKGTTNLFPCYVNGYNVVLPGKDYTLIYVSRAVNASDDDRFMFTLTDRFQKIGLKVPVSGKDYNIEMVR